jgi:hypothetical protein
MHGLCAITLFCSWTGKMAHLFVIIPVMGNTGSGVVSNTVLGVVKIVLQHRFITRRHVLLSRG